MLGFQASRPISPVDVQVMTSTTNTMGQCHGINIHCLDQTLEAVDVAYMRTRRAWPNRYAARTCVGFGAIWELELPQPVESLLLRSCSRACALAVHCA
jgi:hypothetical protein